MSGATDPLDTAMRYKAGVPDRQANAHVRVIDEAVGDLVTREHLDMKLRAEFAHLEQRLLRLLLIQTGVIIAAVVALLRLIP